MRKGRREGSRSGCPSIVKGTRGREQSRQIEIGGQDHLTQIKVKITLIEGSGVVIKGQLGESHGDPSRFQLIGDALGGSHFGGVFTIHQKF